MYLVCTYVTSFLGQSFFFTRQYSPYTWLFKRNDFYFSFFCFILFVADISNTFVWIFKAIYPPFTSCWRLLQPRVWTSGRSCTYSISFYFTSSLVPLHSYFRWRHFTGQSESKHCFGANFKCTRQTNGQSGNYTDFNLDFFIWGVKRPSAGTGRFFLKHFNCLRWRNESEVSTEYKYNS